MRRLVTAYTLSFLITMPLVGFFSPCGVHSEGEGMLTPGLVTPNPNGGSKVMEYKVEVGVIEPDDVSQLEIDAALAPQISATDLEDLRLRVLELRETVTDLVDNNPRTDASQMRVNATGLPGSPVGPTELADAVAPETLDITDFAEIFPFEPLLFIGRNNAAVPGSTLAEPAAANEGRHVFATGNTHAEYSTDGGMTWNDVPIPPGPSDAPVPCCDQDVDYDQARTVTFWSLLYVDPKNMHGVVRIFVRPKIPGPTACSYTINAGSNILMDYPHMAISNNHLYLTSNNIDIETNQWAGAQVRRFGISEMATCQPTPFSVFQYGPEEVEQRVFVPIEGARETMYWGMLQDTEHFTIFKWHQDAGGPTSVTREISESTFENPDCRGGYGNYDFIERSTAWSITGFRLRGVLGRDDSEKGMTSLLRFYWNAAPDKNHEQAHVRAAAFRESDLALVGEPHIFNNDFCFGYPAVTANDRGAIGLSIAAGGRRGGFGRPAEGYVGIDDDFTPGMSFVTVYTTASGFNNRVDGRYGDYFTANPHEPCDLWFTVTNYSLVGNWPNVRYVEFGRGRDIPCYLGWWNSVREDPW